MSSQNRAFNASSNRAFMASANMAFGGSAPAQYTEETLEDGLVISGASLTVKVFSDADDSLIVERTATADIKFPHIGRWLQIARFLGGFQTGQLRIMPISLAGFSGTTNSQTYASLSPDFDEGSCLGSSLLPGDGVVDVVAVGNVVTLSIEDATGDMQGATGSPGDHNLVNYPPAYALVSEGWPDDPGFGETTEALLATFVFDDWVDYPWPGYPTPTLLDVYNTYSLTIEWTIP